MTRSYLKSNDYKEESGGVMQSSAMKFLLGFILFFLILGTANALR